MAGNKFKPVKTKKAVTPQMRAEAVEKQAFIACVAALTGFSLSAIGIGICLGVVGLILGWKAVRADGTRPGGAKVAIVVGILSIVIGIPGAFVLYATFNDVPFLHTFFDSMKEASVIMLNLI